MKKYTYIAYITILTLFVLIPESASAATVYLESSRATVSVGDTVIVTAKINAEAATINTVEGDIVVKSGTNLAVQEFSLANSSFGLWPRTPSLSKDLQTISFVGGVPGGFNIEGATLFKIILEAKKEGVVSLTPQNIAVYANDGKGTKLAVQVKPVAVTVTAKKAGVAATDEWSSVVANDTTPPGDFIVVLGQDASLFSGKKFAFFSALDNQSGVSYYEVSENGAPAVRSGSTYVLQNQNGEVKLSVTAFDKAGNKKTAIYPTAGGSTSSPWLIIIIIVVVLIIAWFIYKKWKAPKKNIPHVPFPFQN